MVRSRGSWDLGSKWIQSSNHGVAVERRRHLRLDDADDRGVGNPWRSARKVGVAMTVSPIRFGQNTAIFMAGGRSPRRRAFGAVVPWPDPLTAHEKSFSKSSSRAQTGRSRARTSSMISLPAVSSSPIRRARSGAGPSKPARSLTKSFCVVKTRLAPRSWPNVPAIADIFGGIGVMIGEDAEIEQLAAQGLQRAPKSLGVADPAERRDRSGRKQRRGTTRCLRRRSGRAGVPGLDPAQRAGAAARPRPGSPPGRPLSTRSARDKTTTPARRSERIGSRSSPRGKRCPRPNGSRASSSTISTSRPNRRCWNPSSRTISSALELVRGDCGQRDAIGILEMRDVGQVFLEDPPLVVQALGLPVAPAQDRDPHAPLGDTSGRPTRPSASCRFRPE